MLNNFTYHKYFLKINLSCKKRRWSGKISKIEQNNVKNGVIGQKRDILSRTGHVKQLYSSYIFRKYQVELLKEAMNL